MRTLLSLALLTLTAGTLLAQDEDAVQRSSSPRGVQIQGETQVNAGALNMGAVAAGDDSAAHNAVGSLRDNVQIQGTTRVNVNAQKVNSLAVGNKNSAGNDVGGIGGK